MDEQPNNAEDKLFKATFSRPEFAKELLLRCVPNALTASLLLDTLELTNASYVDEDLSEHFADLVFNCSTANGAKAKVSFLLEHKSYLPPNPPLQILNYQVNGWRQQIKSRQKPAPILPVLFYHGKEVWIELPWAAYLVGMQPQFEPYTPSGKYMLIDLSELSDDAIRAFRFGFLKTVLLLMKHRYEREFLLNNLTNILIFVEEETEIEVRTEDLHTILRYLTASISLDWNEVKTRSLPLIKINKAMTALEEFKIEFREEALKEGRMTGLMEGREEGRKEGRKEGRQEGRQEGKKEGRIEGYLEKTKETVISLIEFLPDQPDEKIALIAKVDLQYVQAIRLELQQGKSM